MYWYPDDAMCRRKGVIGKYSWIRMQKKIIKIMKDMATCYTYKMLDRNRVVARGIVGIDLGKPKDPQIER